MVGGWRARARALLPTRTLTSTHTLTPPTPHTPTQPHISYTALMNVCIKCGKLPAALDIFAAMQAEGCAPNVVTFNTLIDVYGKLGQWEAALGVLRAMRAEVRVVVGVVVGCVCARAFFAALFIFVALLLLCVLCVCARARARASLSNAPKSTQPNINKQTTVQGVAPVLRTYNTLVIACNMCSQPREALAVHATLLAEGFAPNSTTCNALISAHGKLGALDKALEVLQGMVWKGLERSVITYTSLISAAERAGRWEAALTLFEQMQRDGCAPNTVTFNSLISACGQGGQGLRGHGAFAGEGAVLRRAAARAGQTGRLGVRAVSPPSVTASLGPHPHPHPLPLRALPGPPRRSGTARTPPKTRSATLTGRWSTPQASTRRTRERRAAGGDHTGGCA